MTQIAPLNLGFIIMITAKAGYEVQTAVVSLGEMELITAVFRRTCACDLVPGTIRDFGSVCRERMWSELTIVPSPSRWISRVVGGRPAILRASAEIR